MRRLLLRLAVCGLAVTATLAVATALLLRPARLNALIVTTLSAHLNLEASIEEVTWSWFPRPRIAGAGLTLRVRRHPELPAFVRVDRFSADVGLLSAVRRHVDTLRLEGVRIAVPPRGAAHVPDVEMPAPARLSRLSDLIVDQLVTRDAVLMFVPLKPGSPPVTFNIHDLSMTGVRFERSLPFSVRFTNPAPAGLIEAQGTIGPWRKSSPDDTAVDGAYTLTNGDLSTMNGISGRLTSRGEFHGRLTTVDVTGYAEVPNLNLDLGGKPVPLSSSFTGTMDGTQGSMTLTRVEATVFTTPMIISGAITNLGSPGRLGVELDAHISDGRIEDVLALVLDTASPIMTGDVHADAKLSIAPGASRLRDRLRIAGRFGLAGTTFNDGHVQSKLQELSRRGRGKRADDPVDRVLTNLKGRFQLNKGKAVLDDLAFQVPGANVALSGTYGLASGDLDFRGTLALDATASQAIGGFKSIFVRPFDGMFRKEGAGTVLPIRISGTREQPTFDVQVGGRFFRQGNDGVKPESGAGN